MDAPERGNRMTDTVLEMNAVTRNYAVGGIFSRRRTLQALRGIDLKVEKGKTLGLVGESGCGKTTVGRTIMGLTRADAGEGDRVAAGARADGTGLAMATGVRTMGIPPTASSLGCILRHTDYDVPRATPPVSSSCAGAQEE
jgi:ABC-type glutathione transport system ATPase component